VARLKKYTGHKEQLLFHTMNLLERCSGVDPGWKGRCSGVSLGPVTVGSGLGGSKILAVTLEASSSSPAPVNIADILSVISV